MTSSARSWLIGLRYSVVRHATIRIGFADQMIFSFNASPESAALIECFVIPSPGSASPIKLAFFAEQPATPDQTTA
ncbi:hypothetical protein AB0F18_28595 [Streptomyces sp. NPDC029216]|uniref:hypothetical protein n=1 Tax=Streptomyces sp. NPDC029216 TaxID=3154701 RepID=UPI0034011F86